MSKNHDLNSKKHVSECEECIKKLEQKLCTELASNFQDNMVKILKKSRLPNRGGFFQGKACQFVSSFALSFCIKILKENKISESLIEEMLNDTIDTARRIESEVGHDMHREH